MKNWKMLFLLLGMVGVGMLGCGSPEAEKSNTENMEEVELDSEPGFVEFLAQFPDLALPLTVGSADFADEKAFPEGPELENGAPQAVALYEAVGEKGNRLVPLGRILKERSEVLLLVLESSSEYKRVYLVAYTQDGEQVGKSELASCMVNGEYEMATIKANGCVVKSGEFISLTDDADEEMDEQVAESIFEIGSGGKLVASEKCK